MPSSPPNILVIRRRYLGDLVLLGSFFRNLRLHWPSAKITALVEAPGVGVLTLNPDVGEIIPLAKSFGGAVRQVLRLRRARYTHVFDLDNNDRTALLTRLTRAPARLTLNQERVRPRFPGFYTQRVFVSNRDYDAAHITEHYLRLLAPAGVPVVTREVRLVPHPSDLAAARALLQSKIQNQSPKILIHPGSRSPFRLWPADRFARVIDRAQTELGARAGLIAGPGEQAVVAEIHRLARSAPAVLSDPLTIPQLAALMTCFDLMLCHDSGPMHLAAAVGTPVVALYGSQNAAVWHPLGDRHTVLQAPLPCDAGCVAPETCARGDSYRNYCVRRLSEEDVFAAVRTALRANRPRL